jgi:hypothetical protein
VSPVSTRAKLLIPAPQGLLARGILLPR